MLAALAMPHFAAADGSPAASPVVAGSAPDFQYRANDGRWRTLRDLRAQGHVLLVFEAGDAQLVALERETDSLHAQDVIPIAVFRAGDAANWSRIERLGLTYSLLSDPRGEVAAEFEAAAIPTPGAPAWCLVDRDGRMCGFDRGALPESGFAGAVETALHLREGASAVRP